MPKTKNPIQPTDKKDIEENKTMAALSYFWVLFLIPMLLKRKSKFAQFHAKQGLVLFIAESIFFWFPPLILVALIVSVIGIYKAMQGEYWKIPFVGELAEKFNV